MWNGQAPVVPNGIPQVDSATKGKKSVIVFAVIILAIAIAAAVAVFVAIYNSSPHYKDDAEMVQALLDDEEATPNIIVTELYYILEEKGADEYIKHFQMVIDSADDDESKAGYYLVRAEELYSFGSENGNLSSYREQIFADAKESEKLAPSIDSAYALYTYYGAFGDDEMETYYENLFDERCAESIDAEDE